MTLPAPALLGGFSFSMHARTKICSGCSSKIDVSLT
jgi:hypothetical protein